MVPGYFNNLSVWLKGHAIIASLIVLLCSLSLRLFFAWRTDQIDLINAIPDAGSYLGPAQHLLQRGAFLDANNKPMIERTPGYPVFVVAIMLLVGQDWRKVLITQAIILSCSVLVLYLLARHILPPVTAFIGGLLAAFSPWGAALAGFPLTDGLFLLLLALSFLAMKLIERLKCRATIMLGGACVGVLTGAAVMVRPIWPLVILIAVALFFLYGPRQKGIWLLLVAMLAFAVIPLFLWKERNQRVSQFNGLTDLPGKGAWHYLASRVTAQINGQDRFAVQSKAMREDRNWKMSAQEANDERWQRAKAVFRENPILTVYCFFLSAAEHAIHPSPDVLTPAKLNFHGDYWALALVWGGLLTLASLGWPFTLNPEWEYGPTDRRWLLAILVICLLLTLSTGIAFGAGSRYRVLLELIVPLLAAAGLLRMIGACRRIFAS